MLFDQLKSDRIQAMKSKDRDITGLLGCVIGESSKVDKVPSNEKVIGTIRKFIKGAEDTLKIISEKSSGDVMVGEMTKLEAEVKVLKSYLPTMMDEQEIKDIVDMRIEQGDNLGNIMKFFGQHYSGLYDGKIVSEITKKMLTV